jgi:hypothetical protein
VVSRQGTETNAAADAHTVDVFGKPFGKPQSMQAPQNGGSASGAVAFQVSISVDMEEMSRWEPDRIAAFFSGLARVISAKKGLTKVLKDDQQ